MIHTCHAIHCKNKCPPAWLMCKACWRQVSYATQQEVYFTVNKRGPHCDRTWAPWWRAQAKAIAEVAEKALLDWDGTAYLEREMAFVDTLEKKE